MFGQRLITQVKNCLKEGISSAASSATTWIHVVVLHQTACSASSTTILSKCSVYRYHNFTIRKNSHPVHHLLRVFYHQNFHTMNLRLATWLLATTTALMPSTANAAGVRGKDDQDKQQRRVLQEGQSATYLVQDNEYGHDETGRRLNLFGNRRGPEKLNTVELSNNLIYTVEGFIPPGWQRSGQDVFLPPATIIDDETATITLPNSNGNGNGRGNNKGKGRLLEGKADVIPKVESALTEDQERNLSELNRQLAVVTGQKTVLAVKVVLSDAAYGFADSYLECKVFGTSNGGACGDTLHLANAYSACSFGKLQLGKAADRTTGSGNVSNISNGVVTVTLPAFSASQGDGVVRNEVTNALNAAFGSATSLANHLMYCLPPGTMGGEFHEINILHATRVFILCTRTLTLFHTPPCHHFIPSRYRICFRQQLDVSLF